MACHRGAVGVVVALVGACVPEAIEGLPGLDADTSVESADRIAALTVHPASFSLVDGAGPLTLQVEAWDVDGASLGVLPPASLTWYSTAPDVLPVDDDGRVTRGAQAGLADLVVRGPGGLEATASGAHLQLVPGVRALPDEAIVGPVHLEEAVAGRPGSTWRFGHTGPALRPGDLVLATGASPVAGEVVSVTPSAEGSSVVVRVVAAPRLLLAPLAVSVPLDAARVELVPALADELAYDAAGGVFLPRAEEGRAVLRLACATPDGEPAEGVEVEVWASRLGLRSDLGLDVALGPSPRALLRGALHLDLDAEVHGVLQADGLVHCEVVLGRLRPDVGPGYLRALVGAGLDLGLSVVLDGRIEVATGDEGLRLQLDQDTQGEVGLTCADDACDYLAQASTEARARGLEVEGLAEAVTEGMATIEASAWAAATLPAAGDHPVELARVRGGMRAVVTRAVTHLEQLDDPLVRDDLRTEAFVRLGAGPREDQVASLATAVTGWLGVDVRRLARDTDLALEHVVAYDRLPRGTLEVAGDKATGGYRFDVALTRTDWDGVYVVDEVAVLQDDGTGAGWREIAAAPGGGQDRFEIGWVPPAPLTGAHRFAVLVRASAPVTWWVEPHVATVVVLGDAEDCVPFSSQQVPGLGKTICIPGGTFTMGCVTGRDDAAGGCFSSESPSHPVTLTRAYWMMEAPVTQEQFEAVMGYQPSTWVGFGPHRPVETLTWPEAVAFADATSVSQGLEPCGTANPYVCNGWRLPTEAEWERAARAEEDHAFAGSDDPDEVAWYLATAGTIFDGTGPQQVCDGQGCTQPVCQLLRNSYGLCDMSGNVWEWVFDRYDAFSFTARTDPIGAISGAYRVSRGGAWSDPPRQVRIGYRIYGSPDYTSNEVGFRLVRTTP